jgi:hypothetical protein
MKSNEPVPTIPYSKDIDIRNMNAMARGLNAPFLLVTEGHAEGVYIASQWKRKLPKALKPREHIIAFPIYPKK